MDHFDSSFRADEAVCTTAAMNVVLRMHVNAKQEGSYQVLAWSKLELFTQIHEQQLETCDYSLRDRL